MSISEVATSDIEKKMPESTTYPPSISNGEVTTSWRDTIANLETMFVFLPWGSGQDSNHWEI
jgi:hypothetical protein